MPYFTKYAEQKFDILNKHKVFITKEQVEDAIGVPDKIIKKQKYYYYQKENIKVVCRKEDDLVKVITFYPIK
jgi:hypothetical protein